jgi:methionyl-tRNA synthetase
MPDKPSFYLTTPIYYVNGVPHLGTAYTTIASDALARAMRLDGRDTWFLTGLDEHGQKVAQAAEAEGISPQEWVDGVAPKFLDAWAALDISNDDFIRTTQERHIRGVQRFFTTLYEKGAIYKDIYQGYYCVPEETFFTAEQLSEFAEAREAEGLSATSETGEKLCPDCHRPLSYVEEENLFFRLSDYGPALLEYYASHPDFVSPEIRRNEVVSFVRGGLKDLSVSRTTFDWGVPIPFAPGHVSYVWVDALINYMTAVGYGSDDSADVETFARRWPAQIHFVGKDIIRFHCVIWPAMLMAAGLPLPQRVFAHGFLLTKGEKMSKSRGNVMAPLELAQLFTVDGYRYYFLSDVQFGADGSISLARMLQVYNSDLANSWGNLCSRVFNMTDKYLGGEVPDLWPKTTAALTREMGNPLAELAGGLYERYIQAMENIDYTGALTAVLELVQRANLYLEESAPWQLAKAAAREAEEAATEAASADAAGDAAAEAASGTATASADAANTSPDPALSPTEADRLAFVLYNTLEAIRIAALYFAPVMPLSSTEVWRRLGLGDPLAVRELAEVATWGGLPAGNRVEIGEPLFPRLKAEDIGLGDDAE